MFWKIYISYEIFSYLCHDLNYCNIVFSVNSTFYTSAIIWKDFFSYNAKAFKIYNSLSYTFHFQVYAQIVGKR